jgi:hypothetical protein
MYYLYRGHAALRYKPEGQLLVLMCDYTISTNITPIYSAQHGPTPEYNADYSGHRLLSLPESLRLTELYTARQAIYI